MGSTTLTTEQTLGIGGIIGAFFAVYAIIAFVWWILQIIAKWKIFTKAGEAGWKSIIPIYNDYVTFKFTWATSKFWIIIALAVVLGISRGLMNTGNQIVALIAAIITIIVGIILIVMSIKSEYYLAKAFGKGAGFTVGLIFLNPIFMLILGFGKSEYVGNKSQN